MSPASCRGLSRIHRRASCTDVGFPPAFKQPAAGGKLKATRPRWYGADPRRENRPCAGIRDQGRTRECPVVP